jgi:membrane protein involved in colicin uptake
MDTSVLIWIIVAVVVVAVIVGIVLMTSRRRAEHQRQLQHDKADKLREEARQAELAAREREAKAAQVRADSASAAAEAEQAKARAAQADVEARRLADSVGEHDSDAAKQRQAQAEALRKADEIDPLVNTDGSRSQAAGTRTTAEMPQSGIPGSAPADTHNTAPDGVGGSGSQHGDPVIAGDTTTDTRTEAETRRSGDERRV